MAGSLGFGSSDGLTIDPKFGPDRTLLFQCFSSLLKDQEAEVRAAAADNIARMAQLGGQDCFASHIAPALPGLADDPVVEVRSKLAQTLMDCCDESICTTLTDQVILSDFKPLLEGFLQDEFAEVQLHVLTKLSNISRLLSKMDAVVGSVLAMTKAPNWRVREAVGRLLPHLADARGVSFFEDHLREPWLRFLLDQVADVRSACVAGMPHLLRVAGPEWLQREIFPHYVRIYDESSSYLTRITILRSFAALASADPDAPISATKSLESGGEPLDSESPASYAGISLPLLEDVVSLMLRGLDDRVANVRMVSAKGLAGMLSKCDASVLNSKVRSGLSTRANEDEDDDCRYFSQLALDSCA